MACRDDPQYKLIATELYRLNAERLKAVSQTQADYGKWLIATLSVIHSAAIYALATLHSPVPPRYVFVPFVIGLLLTLSSGLCSWSNFTFAIRLLEGWTDPAMLLDDARWPTIPPRLGFWISATMVAAIVTGVASALCILWGAWLFLCA